MHAVGSLGGKGMQEMYCCLHMAYLWLLGTSHTKQCLLLTAMDLDTASPPGGKLMIRHTIIGKVRAKKLRLHWHVFDECFSCLELLHLL